MDFQVVGRLEEGYSAKTAPIRLHRNELPFDWPNETKERIVNEVLRSDWNKYPSSYGDELNAKIAEALNIQPAQVQTGPGGNYLISLALTALAPKASKLVVLRPSFPLYTKTCEALGLQPSFWNLDADLDFDVTRLPNLGPNSLVVLASPNNPGGSGLSLLQMKDLLLAYPQTLFIVDTAYDCFAGGTAHSLIRHHANLLVIHTYSKSHGSVAPRCGFVAGSLSVVAKIRAHLPQFMLNPLSFFAMHAILDDKSLQAHIASGLSELVRRRDEFVRKIDLLPNRTFAIKQTTTNFMMLKWPSAAAASAAWQHMLTEGILTLNCGLQPELSNWIRVTVGNEHEMAALYTCLSGMKL